MRRGLLSFLRDRRGVSAVEFALISPIVAGLLVFAWDGWQAANAQMKMRNALQAGAEYVMTGQADDNTAKAVVSNYWAGKPTGAAVTVVRACKCGGADNVCTGLCPNTTTPPSVFVTLTASGTGQGLFKSRSLSQQLVVRVR
jgi:Flp pilus assembly protein TadG